MEPKIVKDPTPPVDQSKVEISQGIVNALAQTEIHEWEAFFAALRLNVQSRIIGSSRDDLVKIQARLEQIEDERAFFKKLLSKPVTSGFN